MSDKNLAGWMKTLGLPANAKRADAKKRFRELSKQYHPEGLNYDPNNQDSNEKFYAVVEAWNNITEWFAKHGPLFEHDPNLSLEGKMHLLDLAAFYTKFSMPNIMNNGGKYGDLFNLLERGARHDEYLSSATLKAKFPFLEEIAQKRLALLEEFRFKHPELNIGYVIYSDEKIGRELESYPLNQDTESYKLDKKEADEIKVIGDLKAYLLTTVFPGNIFSNKEKMSSIIVTDMQGNLLKDNVAIKTGLTRFVVYTSATNSISGNIVRKATPIFLAKGSVAKKAVTESIEQFQSDKKRAIASNHGAFDEIFGAFLIEQIRQHGEFLQYRPLAQSDDLSEVGAVTGEGGDPLLLENRSGKRKK